jgi:hypothetical protein
MNLTEAKKHGGARANSGRPKGARGKALVARELATKGAIDDTLARLTKDEIERLSPLEIMILAMHLLLTQGNLMGAVSVAKEAAPYVHAKVASQVFDLPLPADLQADPKPEPDEPTPTLIE